MTFQSRRVWVHSGLAVCLALAASIALSPRPALGQALQIMYTFNDGLGNGNTTDAVNAPVTSQAAVSNAQVTIYVWGLVTDLAAPTTADSQLGLSLAFMNAESTATGTGAFSTGSGIGLTAPMSLTTAWSNGGPSGTLTNAFGLSGVESLGSTSTAKTVAQPLQAEPSDGINFEFGGGTASTTSMPYGAGSATATGGWAFLLGTLTFTEGVTGSSYTGTTSMVPLLPSYSTAKDAFTTSTAGSPSGLTNESTAAWTSAGGVTFTAPPTTTSTNYTLAATTTAANIHVSGSSGLQSAPITSTITNTGTGTADTLSYSGLTASATGMVSGSSTSSVVPLTQGQSGSNTGLSFSSATAGQYTVTPVVDSATNGTLGGSATLSGTTTTTVTVWNLANPATIPTANLGIVHVGESFGTQALTVQNAAPASYSEGLDASFSGTSGNATTNGGSTPIVAANGSDTTSMVVGLGGNAHTGSVGTVTGSATVGLASDGANTSGLGTTSLSPQVVSVTGQVYNYAQPALSLSSGSASLDGSGNSYTLNMGTNMLAGSGSYTANLALANASLSPGYQDTLGGSFNTSGVSHYTLGNTGPFSNVAAGGSMAGGLQVTLNTNNTGASDSLVFNPTSTNTSTSSNLSPITIALNDVAGQATIDNSGSGSTFGGNDLIAVIGSTPGSNSYAGISATVTSNLYGSVQAGAGGGAVEHTVAQILLGNNSGSFIAGGGSATVGITFRNRSLAETPTGDNPGGTNTTYGPPLAGLPLISDVARLYGMNTQATATSSATVQTDPFVFQMSYNPATIVAEGSPAQNVADRGNVYLASLTNGIWQNAIDADFQIGSGESSQTTQVNVNGTEVWVGNSVASNNFLAPYLGSFTAWEMANPNFNTDGTNIGSYLGVWGVDPINDQAWAIINHNSDFAVVPEPSTFILAAFAGLGLIWAVRRKKKFAIA